MALTDEQAKQIKSQLLKQIAQLPEDQQKQAKEYIESMDNEQLEQFLKQQQIQYQQSPQSPTNNPQKQGECVFCALAKKQMPSIALYEDKDYLAALEIRPFTQGHTILIPKKHIKQTKSIPSKALTLANKIGRHLVKQLKAESFQVTTTAEMNHAIVNIIPVYKNQQLTYQRKESKQDELQKLAIKIGEVPKRAPPKKKPKTEKPTDKKESSLPQYPRRIPR